MASGGLPPLDGGHDGNTQQEVNVPHPGVPRDWFRTRDGMGLWESRGKVVATGIGTSPTSRRWDEKPENSMGALTIMAIRKAIADAGISPEEIDGLVLTPESTTG